MTPRELWEGTQRFRREFFSLRCTAARLRRSGVRPLQSLLLNHGYRRALANRIPGAPVPRERGSADASLSGAVPRLVGAGEG